MSSNCLTVYTHTLFFYNCSVAQSCLTLCDPMDCSMPGFPVLHCLPEFAQTHIHWVNDAMQPSHPLLPPSPSALNLSQHQCPTPCDPRDYNLPGSSVHGIFQARILEWVAISSSRGSFQHRNGIQVSCIFFIGSGFFNTESPGKSIYIHVCMHKFKDIFDHLYRKQVSQMDKEAVVHIHHGILLSH